MSDIRTGWPGSAAPLGATVSGEGTNFAVFSAPATSVTLCLFDDDGAEHQVALTEVDSAVWHGFVPGVRAGQRYGYRVDGPWRLPGVPRCNPAKLLLDPYALAVDGDVVWGRGPADEALFDYRWADRSRSALDSAPLMPRSVVVDRDAYAWQHDADRPNRPLADSIVYECHVKGMTARHPDVPEAERGTYAGLARLGGYFAELGITAVELMPVHQFVSEQELRQAGRSDYWGYNTIGFFAPHNGYASAGTRGQQVEEFKAMVDTLHGAGVEVILDVVYNHTAEGGSLGPSLCHRGLDQGSYYLLDEHGATVNESGTGNTWNVWDPAALRLVLDSLRYWVQDMHVDGFRFDLATVLAATDPGHQVSVFLDIVAQDPVLAPVKLIAEPWNPGPDDPMWMLGRFPSGWSQWNDQFRNGVRDVWRSVAGLEGQFRQMLEGSPATFAAVDANLPDASVNYAVSHDGLPLRDLVSYNDDGQRAWDSRDPGDTDTDVAVRRANRTRAMLMTVLLAQGLPMLAHGDEIGRTLRGNANSYDQDSELTWLDWADADRDLLVFTRALIRLRRDHPVFRQSRLATSDGTPRGTGVGLDWYAPDGQPLGTGGGGGTGDGDGGGTVTLTVHLDGSRLGMRDAHGRAVADDSFLLMVNAWWQPLAMTVPHVGAGWTPVLDASAADGTPASTDPVRAGAEVTVAPRAALLLRG